MSELGDSEEQKAAVARMPILAELVDHLRKDRFSFGQNVLLFGTQHLMRQALGLTWALNALGIRYQQMFISGKAYSTHPATFRELQALGVNLPPERAYRFDLAQVEEQVTDLASLQRRFARLKARQVNPTIVVLDDGGHALTNILHFVTEPYSIIGVEQTASGFIQPGIKSIPFPTVDVAASAVKRLCEPPMVIAAALHHADRILREWPTARVGIVGLGYVGSALFRALAARGVSLAIFDERPDAYPDLAKGIRARRVHDVFEHCDVIFGCTGSDITADLEAEVGARGLTPRVRYLASLSSGDDEFFSLKKALLRRCMPLARTYSWESIPDIVGECWGSSFTIARNGFPINFDNSGESAPLEQIQGTIAALIAAVCQASRIGRALAAPVHTRMKLEPAFQGWLFAKWVCTGAHPDEARASVPRLAVR